MNIKLLTPLMAAALATVSQAQVVFSDNFDVDSTSSWSFFSSISGDAANDNSGSEADFFFDYSTVGIGAAPNSQGGSTRGLKLNANIGTGLFSATSVSPNGQSFSGDYTLKFDAWLNSVGPFPAGGSGSTQLTTAGVGGVNGLNWQGGAMSGVSFGATGEGGSGNDYRAYVAAGSPLADTSGAYAAGSVAGASNNTNAYYSSFQGSVPAAQLGLYPQQTGAPAVGTQGFAWRSWEITKTGDVMTWTIDGLLIATATKANMTGSNIFFNHSDINAGSSTSPDSEALIFGLVDNVVVTQAVPEPATMTILALGALAALKRRKKA